MRVLILGGTGNIGTAVLKEAVRRGHFVYGLTRSEQSAEKVSKIGATPVFGDIRSPEHWLSELPAVDGVIQISCDLVNSMFDIERPLLEKLFARFRAQGNMPKFIYTGGNWLFGSTGDTVGTEESDYNPCPEFAWQIPNIEFTLASSAITPIIIHPGMTYRPDGGSFGFFMRDARKLNFVRVVGSESVRWSLVHHEDLADLYVLALERAAAGAKYLGVSIEGFPVGRIARAVAGKFGLPSENPRVVSADDIALELGSMARGYGYDQQLSGAKARKELGWQPRYLDPENEIDSPNV